MSSNRYSEFIESVRKYEIKAGQAIREALEKVAEESKDLIKSWNDLYYKLAVELGNREVKKQLRQQSVKDRRQQLERSRKRQQLAAANKDKPNNWRRLHGLPARRKVKQSYKRH